MVRLQNLPEETGLKQNRCQFCKYRSNWLQNLPEETGLKLQSPILSLAISIGVAKSSRRDRIETQNDCKFLVSCLCRVAKSSRRDRIETTQFSALLPAKSPKVAKSSRRDRIETQ